jgi:glycine/D-amino acid oxidase-like deaminating enzyme
MPDKICVIGAGIQGVLCALELAERGCEVVILDAADASLTKASRHNEGKIHLGYIYSKDLSDGTARLMIESATLFEPFLNRWWPQAAMDASASSRFDYVVMRDSLENADWLEERYRQIDDFLAQRMAMAGRRYLGARQIVPARRMNKRMAAATYNPDYCETVFETDERAIDVAAMTEVLSATLIAHPKIECRWDSRVESVSEHADGSYWVTVDECQPDGPFGHIVNATWADRLRVDATLGIHETRPVMYRLKIAHRIQLPPQVALLPSATMVIGPYGDVVGLPSGSCYLSWYPSGCIRRSTDMAPPPEWADISAEEVTASFEDAVAELSRRVPTLHSHLGAIDGHVSIPGVIVCWGETDVDDPASELHLRREVGVTSHGRGYHSIDTGKLALAPLFAMHLAERICPT